MGRSAKGKSTMDRKINPYSRFYVPTRLDTDDSRHIISYRDGPALCGQEATGEQTAPHSWSVKDVCPRCAQQYVKQLVGALTRPPPLRGVGGVMKENEQTVEYQQSALRKLRGDLNGFECKCGADKAAIRHALWCPTYIVRYITALLEGTPLPE